MTDIRLDVKALETKVDELLVLLSDLERQQASLKADKESWLKERRSLVEKNELARNKIEAMIVHLKSLEQD